MTAVEKVRVAKEALENIIASHKFSYKKMTPSAEFARRLDNEQEARRALVILNTPTKTTPKHWQEMNKFIVKVNSQFLRKEVIDFYDVKMMIETINTLRAELSGYIK